MSFHWLALVHYKWWPLDYKNSDCSQLRIKKKTIFFSFTTADYFLLNTFNTMEAEKNLLSADVQNSITLRVPSFNTNRPKLWFHRLEAIFSNRKIISQRIMFTHVEEALPSETPKEIEDILEHPSILSSYSFKTGKIRQCEVERTSQQRLNGRQKPFSTSAFHEKSSGTQTHGWKHHAPALVRKVTTSNDAHPNGLPQREDAVSARRTRWQECRHLSSETIRFPSLVGEPQGRRSSLTPM